MLDPDVLTTAILIPDLINTDILDPIHELDHGRRTHREGGKIQHLSNKMGVFSSIGQPQKNRPSGKL